MSIVKFFHMIQLLKNKNKNPKGIIITGDSNNIAKDESIIIKELTQLSLPILVISKNFDAAEYFSEFDVEQIDMELIQSLEGITLIKNFYMIDVLVMAIGI